MTNKKEIFTQDELLAAEKLAKFLVKHGLTTPAIFYIELNRPLNYVGSQFLALFEPFVKAFVLNNGYENFINFLEKRESVDILLNMIEEYDKKFKEELKSKKLNKKKKRSGYG